MRKISIILILAMLPGCAFLQNIDINQGKLLVRAASRTGTIAFLTSVDEEKRQEYAEVLKTDISDNVLRMLEGDGLVLNPSTGALLFQKIPLLMRPFLTDAFEILIAYQALDSDVISSDAVILIKAFFQGVIQGCDLILGGQTNASMDTGSHQPVAAVYETEGTS